MWGNTDSAFVDGAEIHLAGSGGDLTVDYSNVRDRNGSGVSGSITWGSGNIGESTTADDPNFVDLNDYRIECPSKSINTANPTNSTIPADEFDLDGDSITTGEQTPDRDLLPRISASRADMGVTNCK